MARSSWWVGAVAGLVAAVAALGVAELVAPATGAGSVPVVAVGGAVIDAVPGAVKNFAVSTFGTSDKFALETGTLVLLALFAAAFGILGTRRLWYGLAGVAAFGLVGMVAAATRPGASGWWALPSLVGGLVAAGVLALLLRTAGAGTWRPGNVWHPAGPVRAGDRRRFLGTGVAVLAGAAIAGGTGRVLLQRQGVAAARAAVRLPEPASPAPALPVNAVTARAATPFVTPAASFYRVDTALSAPQVDPRTWKLRVYGRVRTPLELTFDDLLARPMIERYTTLTCVSNPVGGPLIGNALWQGVRLADLLREAGPLPGADQVVSRSVDGFTAGTPTAVLLDGRDAMLAVGMNGQPLPVDHGFPVRMVVPGLYGYVSATKWLAELELSSFADYTAYWVSRGWSARAPVKMESRIDTPQDAGQVRAGAVVVAGVAWAQHQGISAVQVQVDNEGWQAASLGAVPSIDTWRQWVWTWQARRGTHTLRVRATDNAGVVQTDAQAPPEPDGATGWHTITVTVT